jgi:Flp pilus assembly protein TadD
MKHKYLGGIGLAAGCALLALLMGCATTSQGSKTPRANEEQGRTSPAYAESADAKTLFAMARVLVLRERQDQAEVVLVRLVNEHPRFFPAYSELAELRLQQGRLDDAKLVLVHGVEKFPQEHILLNNLAVCHLVAADYQEALKAIDGALAFQPANERYRANKALVLGLLGRHDEARTLYGDTIGLENARMNMEWIQSFLAKPGGSTPPTGSQYLY